MTEQWFRIEPGRRFRIKRLRKKLPQVLTGGDVIRLVEEIYATRDAILKLRKEWEDLVTQWEATVDETITQVVEYRQPRSASTDGDPQDGTQGDQARGQERGGEG